MIFLLRTKYLFTVPCTAETDVEGRIFEFPCNRVGIRTKDTQFVTTGWNKSLVIYVGTYINIDIASHAYDFLSVQIDFFKLAFSQYEFSVI